MQIFINIKGIQLFIILITLVETFCYRYTLPGDANWPNASYFLELKTRINGNVIIRGQKDYKPFTWNRITNTPKPAVIVQPTSASDVIEALKFAQLYNIRISVSSTGHHQGVRNLVDNSVHIDMSNMKSKSIDLEKKTLTLEPGNRFSDIRPWVSARSNNRLVALGGADPGVGIYGWTIGGGHGFFTRAYGLGVDALLSIDLVLANLTVITASETQNYDLFRSLRGSGGSAYGIAVSLTVKLYDDPGKISIFTGLYYLNSQTSEMFANWLIKAPNKSSAYFLPNHAGSKKDVLIAAYCWENYSTCKEILSQLQKNCLKNSYIKCVPEIDKYNNYYDFFKSLESDRSGVVSFASTALNESNIVQGLSEIVQFLNENDYTGCSGNAVLGGASAQMDIDQTKTSVAPEMRTSLMAITCYASNSDKDGVDIRKYQALKMVALSETILKKYSKWVYWNEPQHTYPSEDWKERFYFTIETRIKVHGYLTENSFKCPWLFKQEFTVFGIERKKILSCTININ